MAVSKRLALDTNVLFDRANEESFAKDFLAVFQRKGFSFEVPPTVIYELDYFRRKGKGAEQMAAETALCSVQKWGLTPLILTDVQRSYKRNFISIAQNANLLPAKEINDLHILAETAIADIAALVTSDRPLLDIDRVALPLAFQNAGLPTVSPVHPRRMLQALR